MKKAIVFSTVSGNTKKLADVIYNSIGEEVYCGKPCAEATDADMIYVGSWTAGFSCAPDIKAFLESLNNKKIFLFMTAGYGHSDEFFKKILDAAKENINSSNELVGEFICQGEVSESKREAIKKMDMAKFESMQAELDYSKSHPDSNDLENLKKIL